MDSLFEKAISNFYCLFSIKVGINKSFKKEDVDKIPNFTKAKPEEMDVPKETKWHRGNCFFSEKCTLH